MLSIPRLRQSFCGCTLETSSLIIAWLGVLGVAFQLLLGACFFGVFYDHIRNELIKSQTTDDKVEMALFSIRIGAAFVFVVYSASLAINTMLLVGVYKRNYCLMTPWLMMSGAGCALGVLSVVLTLLASFTNAELILVAFLQGLGVAFSVYCFLLIYSYYTLVKEERMMNESRFKPLGA